MLKARNTWGMYKWEWRCIVRAHMEIFWCRWLAGDQGPFENMFWHILSPRYTEAERLRKKWEEEEEERLKQISEPVEPKSKRNTDRNTNPFNWWIVTKYLYQLTVFTYLYTTYHNLASDALNFYFATFQSQMLYF